MERLTYYENGKARYDANGCTHAGRIADRLAAYEDAEEQGLLVRLPFKVGDKLRYRDLVYTVMSIEIDLMGRRIYMFFRCVNPETDDEMTFYSHEIGKTVFVTREEAEAALKEETS